jgi:hypothetical protein
MISGVSYLQWYLYITTVYIIQGKSLPHEDCHDPKRIGLDRQSLNILLALILVGVREGVLIPGVG